MIDVAVGEHDRGDRAVALSLPRMESGIGSDLPAQVWRRVEEKVVLAVGGNGYGRLGLRRNATRTGAGAPATLTVAIPLRETAAGRRSQNQHSHVQCAPLVMRPTRTAFVSGRTTNVYAEAYVLIS